MKIFITTMICILLISSHSSIADEGSLQLCINGTYMISHDKHTAKLFAGCTWDGQSIKLFVYDPILLQIENIYSLNGLIKEVIPINNGYSILVLLSDVDNDETTKDGSLLQLSSLDGSIENEFIFNTYPQALVIDSNENFAYVSSGYESMPDWIDPSPDPSVTKIDLTTTPFSQVGSSIDFGEYSTSMAITNDNSKLYVRSIKRFETPPPEYRGYFQIGVFDTGGTGAMSVLPFLELPSEPGLLEMGYDDRLYISNRYPDDEGEASLYIVNTLTDEIDTLLIDGIGFFGLAIDPENCRLYCSASERKQHPVRDELYFANSNIIYEIDIENNYSYISFELGDEPFRLIEAVPYEHPVYKCRLFGKSYDSNKINYMDIE